MPKEQGSKLISIESMGFAVFWFTSRCGTYRLGVGYPVECYLLYLNLILCNIQYLICINMNNVGTGMR